MFADEPTLTIARLQVSDFSDRAVGDHAARLLQARDIAVRQIYHSDEASSFHRFSHFKRQVIGRRERFFAQDMLTCGSKLYRR